MKALLSAVSKGENGEAMAKKKKTKGATGAGADPAKTIEGKAAEQPRKKKKASPFEFIQQVRNEGSKVTWTSRNETTVSTIMVLIMVAIMALFFFGVDQFLRWSVCSILPIQCGGS